MSFRFTPEFRAQLVAAAAHEHRSQAGMIEILVRKFCAEAGIEPQAARSSRKKT
jgi:predicted HicB family RNase H-like nuclease